MPLTDVIRADINAAIAAGRVPARTASGRLYLNTGHRRSVALTVAGDALTEAGEFYFQQSGQPPPNRGVDAHQTFIHRGNTDYIRGPGGRLQAVRHLQPDGTARVLSLIHI